jgi:hypothetical protein
MKVGPPSGSCNREFDIVTSSSYWLVRPDVTQEINRCPVGGTAWALSNQAQIQRGKDGLLRSWAGLLQKLAICSYIGILSRCVLGPGCAGGFSTSDFSLWIAGCRENLREDTNTQKGKDMRACGVVTGKGGRPWLQECLSSRHAPESSGPASFRAAVPGSPLFSKNKVTLKSGSLSRLTRRPPLLCPFWHDLTLPCFPAVIFHFF